MHPLDVFYLICLMLGGGYMICSIMMGGMSHVAGHLGHLGGVPHIGDALHLPHLTGGDGVHAPAGHIDGGVAAGHVAGQGDALVHGGHGQGHLHADVHGHGQHDGQHVAKGEEHSGGFNLLAYLNPMMASGFLAGFGGVGLVGRYLGLTPAPSLVGATAGGLSLYWSAAMVILRMFGRAQGTSHNRREDVIGLRATVTAPIAGAQPGMVSYVVSGTRQSLRAITDDEEPIPVGSVVRIRRIEQNTARVMRID